MYSKTHFLTKLSYKWIFYLALLFLSNTLFGQFGFDYYSSIQVERNGDTLENPWGGGLNYAQFSDFDYDFDGDLDLFVFDRSTNNIRVFTQEQNGGKHYELAYNAHWDFPPDLKYKATLVDFDNDGRKDLFTQGLGGIKVFRNVGSIANGLQWELHSELIYSDYALGYQSLYVSSSDIPAIIDVDGDSDIDILTFHTGGNNVEYHQNQSMELYGIPDSLVFVQKNECWGKFGEDPLQNTITLNETNYPCVGGNIPNPESGTGTGSSPKNKAHSGSTMLALDYDNSGVLDLVLGDVSYSTMTLLINGGTVVNSDSPMISVDYSFPSNTTPIDIMLFPAAFYLDVDFDGIKDLIACPNVKNISLNESSVFFFKNTGSNANPNFVFVSDNFLQDEMIEHGTGTVPVLYDYDEDGLEDLMVANLYRYKPVMDKESTIAYYRNSGTVSNPSFSFVSNDILNLSAESFGLRSIPAFGDIDNDGDKDLFLGLQDGTLVFYENLSTGSGSVFNNPVLNYQDNNGTVISTGSYCHPQLFDLNNDGLLDLILGKGNGNVSYFSNIGTLNTPSFQLENDTLGNIDVSFTTPNGYAAPHFFQFNEETMCFVGNVDGQISHFSSVDGNINSGESFSLETHNMGLIDVDAYSSCWLNDIDDDGILNLFVGQDLGGVYCFEHDTSTVISLHEIKEKAKFVLYPNPANDKITLTTNELDVNDYRIYNLKGEFVATEGLKKNNKIEIHIDSLEKGVYFISILLKDGGVVVEKIVLL